jgi:YHS domain-containing protein
MRISTLDPISLNDVTDLNNAPYIIDGEGTNALKIYFENEANKAKFLAIPLHTADATVSSAYAKWLIRRLQAPSISTGNNRQYQSPF